MKPGHVGAILVLGAGVALGAAVFAKDRAQLGRARTLYAQGEKLLAVGQPKEAQAQLRDALAAALVVGGITGRRPAALEVATDTRRALRVCDALLAIQKGDASALDAIDEAAQRPGAPREAFEKLSRAELARQQALVAQALERSALETDRRPGDTGRTRAELHALAEKGYALAQEAARKAGLEPDPKLSKGARRAHARALVQAALAANSSGDAAAARKLADEATAALRDAADAFDAADDAAAGGDRERKELDGLVRGITAETRDRERVSAFESDVAKLDARVDTKELGELLPVVNALEAPELEGRHRGVDELAKKIAAARVRLARIRETAEQFEGMVLAVDGPVKVYVDRHEVTNAEFKRFVDEKKPYGAEGRTPEVWGSADVVSVVDDLVDADAKDLGPATWRAGTFPAGKDEFPVAGVSALEARAYARCRGKRLPTYDEWKAAAGVSRGSPVPAYPWGEGWRDAGGNVLPPDGKAAGTSRVGQFPRGRSPVGADDLVGNVRELVEDPAGILAVGGSYASAPEAATLRSALHVDPETRPVDQGFRCAKELSWKR